MANKLTGAEKATASLLRVILLELTGRLPKEQAQGFLEAVQLGADKEMRGQGEGASIRTILDSEDTASAHEFMRAVFHALDILDRSKRG